MPARHTRVLIARNTMLRTDDLNYPLPDDLIATAPAEPRDSARLLVVSRTDESVLEHCFVRDLPEILRPPGRRSTMPPDLMVVNATRVLPARFKGERPDSKGHVEGLYVQPAIVAPDHPEHGKGPLWIVLLKMRRMKPGVRVTLFDRHGRDSGISLRLIERADEAGSWVVAVESSTLRLTPGMTASDLLEWVGLTPVPPYILAARRKGHINIADETDRKHYQTVYATERGERPGYGSVAAPTAGLHFTPGLLDRLRDAGVRRAEVTLDVGLGTFKPIETEFIQQHPMHAEWCSIPVQTAMQIASARAHTSAPSALRPRIIAVGTTAARALESFESPEEMQKVGSKQTRLLIAPGHRWKHVDVLVTNFHLPKSTLLAMVSALFHQGASDDETAQHAAIERLKSIYAVAVRERYRFYSYGDAMVVLP